MYDKNIENNDLKMVRQSIIEELEAISWYETRLETIKDSELRRILEHNRDEEKEHVAMLMEWLKNNDEEQSKAFEEHD